MPAIGDAVFFEDRVFLTPSASLSKCHPPPKLCHIIFLLTHSAIRQWDFRSHAAGTMRHHAGVSTSPPMSLECPRWREPRDICEGSMIQPANGSDLGKLLIVLGGILVIVGVALILSGKIPWLGRLPGD